jgi:hypothetical protein
MGPLFFMEILKLPFFLHLERLEYYITPGKKIKQISQNPGNFNFRGPGCTKVIYVVWIGAWGHGCTDAWGTG